MARPTLPRWLRLVILIGLAMATLEGSRPAWAGDRGMKQFKISGQDELRLMVPLEWKAEFQRPISETAPTIVFLPPKEEAFKLLVTIQWDSKADPEFNSLSRINALLEKEWREMVPSIKETQFNAHKIIGTAARGVYFLATDNEPQPGEYEYMLRAGVGIGKLLVSATLVFQEKDSPVVSDVIYLLKMAAVVSN